MSKTLKLSLSRWHKVAERLAREYTETVYGAKQALTQTRVSACLGESQEKALRDESEEWQKRLAWVFQVQDTLAAVRCALGNANVQNGVAGKLAEFDKLNRRQKVLTELIEGQGADMIAIDELKSIPQDYVADGDRYDSKRPQLRVRMLDRAAVAQLKQQLEGVRSRAYALSDEIADLNRATLSIAIPDDVASLAGI